MLLKIDQRLHLKKKRFKESAVGRPCWSRLGMDSAKVAVVSWHLTITRNFEDFCYRNCGEIKVGPWGHGGDLLNNCGMMSVRENSPRPGEIGLFILVSMGQILSAIPNDVGNYWLPQTYHD